MLPFDPTLARSARCAPDKALLARYRPGAPFSSPRPLLSTLPALARPALACRADNVGDNVGDIAGMGADLFGSFAESTCAALVISAVSQLGVEHNYSGMMFPLLVSATGIIVCLLTTFIATDLKPARVISEIEHTLKMQLIISTLLMTPVSHPAAAHADHPSARHQLPPLPFVSITGLWGRPFPSRVTCCTIGGRPGCCSCPLPPSPLPLAAPQVALAVSVWSLPPTFDMSVPSASTTQAFDTKVRQFAVQVALTTRAWSQAPLPAVHGCRPRAFLRMV